METGKEFSALLQVLSGEQQVIQRTDQKAFTLLSILGVFMVFFIVHFPKIKMTVLIFGLMMIYFLILKLYLTQQGVEVQQNWH